MRSTPAQDIRYTIVEARGAVSFIGPGHLGKMLAAAASANPATVPELFERTRPLDARVVDSVRRGLLTFDEHVLDQDPVDLTSWRARVGEIDREPFRVVNGELRELSLRPDELGLTIVNLIDRRIVQIEDRYGRIERTDRGRIRVDGRPVARYYEYTLPEDWTIVP